MNKIIRLMKESYREVLHSFWSARGILIVLALAFFNYEEIHPIVNYAAEYKEPIVPVAMIFIFNSLHFQVMFGLVTIFLFSEVPFVTKRTIYTVLRTGRRGWLLGKIFRIVITSVIYMLLEVIISVLVCGNDILWSNRWGRVWNTLSLSSDAEGLSVWVPRNILIQYTPVEAIIRVFILGCLVITFIGCFMMLISLLTSPILAIVITGIISVLPYVAVNSAIYYYRIYYLSPMSWIGIIEYSNTYIYKGPGSMDMLKILVSIICILFIALWFIIGNVDLKEGKGEQA